MEKKMATARKTTTNKTTEAKPTETKPAEIKPAGTKAAETKTRRPRVIRTEKEKAQIARDEAVAKYEKELKRFTRIEAEYLKAKDKVEALSKNATYLSMHPLLQNEVENQTPVGPEQAESPASVDDAQGDVLPMPGIENQVETEKAPIETSPFEG